MNAADLFNAGISADLTPKGDDARQAVDSLRGYAYQALATALAWLDIDENGRLYLEVAEDYAIVAKKALGVVQVKDTAESGSVTLNSVSARNAVTAFVDLVNRNSNMQVDLRFFTTSEIGTERAIADRPAGMAGLKYWRKAAIGADLTPLRTILESNKFPESVRAFSKARDDATLRRDLFMRIHWECGKPDFSTLRHELEERLVVVGRDRFSLPSEEARRLADTLVYRVLKKSILDKPLNRVLTRPELYQTIDETTRTSVPRSVADNLTRLASSIAGSLGGGLDPDNFFSIAETGWLIEGSTLPELQGMITRPAVESGVVEALENFNVGVLVGGSGLGKSTVSRAVAVTRADAFFIVDFRDADADKTRYRLDMLFARIGGLPPSMLILEDLNHLDNTHVVLALARVIEALRRRGHEVLITCYRELSFKALAGTGLSQGCVVNCPYFTEEEARKLVNENGGDPKKWGRLAHVAGAFGHPQLTHAFVIGIAARGWPVEDIKDIIEHGLSSSDTDATRNSARRNLVSTLPEGTRNLLYRLSLTLGRFDRSLALTVGAIPPLVVTVGESMDQLVGPWIEAVGRDAYRVSPLANSFGREMLSPEEQKCVHETIAVQMLERDSIDASDIDSIMMHALLGKSPESLAILTRIILSTESHKLEMLAEHLLIFRLSRTDSPIYPEEPLVSGMFRLAQFKLAVAAREGKKISEIAVAILNDISCMPEGEPKRFFEAAGVTLVLGTMGVANYLDNWIALLLRFEAMVETNDFLQELLVNTEGTGNEIGTNVLGMLFGIGSANLVSIDRLEHIINQLDELDPSERALLLTPLDRAASDYSVLINGPWVAEQRSENFDPVDVAMRYQRMAEKTRTWDIRPLSLQCSVALATMLDEYQNNKEGALAVLEEAVAAMGDDLILSRAIAKVYWHHSEHRTALEIFRRIGDQVGGDNPVDRAFALREAAICAAKCNEWSQAEKWFLEAQRSARLAQGDDMVAMAIGLGADSAVAVLEAGEVGRALMCIADAVESLAKVDPEATLCAAYCHRVIRHTVLWVQSRITGGDVKIKGQPIAMEAGTCSNPEPLPAIREFPLGHIDVVWYMLAETETAAGLDVGITAKLEDRLAQEPIPVMEASLRMQMIATDIDKLDAFKFSAYLTRYVEAAVYMLKESGRLKGTFDPLALERGLVPTQDKNAPFNPLAEQVAKEAILAFGIRSALANQCEAIMELEAALESRFTNSFPGKPVFEHWNGKKSSLTSLDQVVISIMKDLSQSDYIEPLDFWNAGLRLFEWINQSNFKNPLTVHLAAWQRTVWRRISTEESFRLSMPLRTVPRIKEVLTRPKDDRSFVAKLILVTSEAVGASLDSGYRNNLKALSEETELPLNATR